MTLNSPNEVTFRYRAEMKISVALAAVFTLIYSIFLMLTVDAASRWVWGGIMLFLLLLFGSIYLRYSGSLTLDGMGVRYTNAFGKETSLAWGEITLRQGAIWRNLALTDSMGGVKININTELNGFEQAVEMIRRRRSDLWQQPGRMYELKANWSILAISLTLIFLAGLVPAVMSAFASAADTLLFAGLILAILGVVLVIMLANTVWRVRLEGDLLSVRRISGEQRLRASEIGDIRLEVVRAGRSGRIAVVRIFPLHGKPSDLRGQFMHIPDLYCVLRTWWEDKHNSR